MLLSSASLLLADVTPTTPQWSFQIALIMITANLFVIAIGRYAIKNPGAGPALPFTLPGLFEGFGLPELLATTSLGHILGAGMVLGLGSAGIL
ncbi:photosystem I reaction center subunit PsaK [Leptolyngbya sp. PCC 6406]|uniref:photosystem I reaction center subunit PsaK n=1 Tax=Leptolyngbya sp. PCC 6406 TaxID=1173264 RepID=UPI0002ABAAB0|nr:photosystem I reaction center subunit PsaK [Leptolyngbya sp. PCC 6406]